MVPYSQRRHRLNGDEIEPVRDAALYRLLQLVKARVPGTLDEAGSLFRIWYRITYYVRNKPSYPPHETWGEIAICMEYDSESLDTGYDTVKMGVVEPGNPEED
jgi:hypothetical protein